MCRYDSAVVSTEPSSDADDAAWGAWASRSGEAAEKPGRPRLLVVLGVAALVVAVAALRWFLSDFGVQKLGDEVEMPVVFLGGSHPAGEARIGVTPLTVRRGTPADLAGWRRAGLDAVIPAGVPHYVDVRLVNEGDVVLDARAGVSAYDRRDRPLERLEVFRPDDPGAQFPPCHGAAAERSRIQPGESATVCVIFDVPPGAALDRLSAGGAIGEQTNWAVD
jgi:hypothetical protein